MKTLAALKYIKRILFNVYVAVNMLIASVIFFPWVYPRETISGFLGRKAFERVYVALCAARFIDFFYRSEAAHCGETALSEAEAREELYPGEFDIAPSQSDEEGA
jgi:hypothetical protein